MWCYIIKSWLIRIPFASQRSVILIIGIKQCRH